MHTPGPWIVSGASGRFAVGPDLVDGMVAAVRYLGNHPHSLAEEAANAHLLAAAPRLRDAVRIAEQLASIALDWNLDEVEIDGEMVETRALRDQFVAALAQARGAL